MSHSFRPLGLQPARLLLGKILHCLLGFAQIHVHRVGDTIQPSYPLASPLLLPPIFPSIRAFSDESVLHIRWPKYWSFSFSISPSSEYSGLISFRMDWLDLLAVQGILKSLLQTTAKKHQLFGAQSSLWPSLSECQFHQTRRGMTVLKHRIVVRIEFNTITYRKQFTAITA